MLLELSPNNPNESRFFDIWRGLSREQRSYVVVRSGTKTKKAAAVLAGQKPDTVYHWGEEVEEAALILKDDILIAALAIRKEALIKAIMVKVQGLESDNETVAQKAASEIIEWELGKANQPISGPGGGPILIAPTTIPLAEDELTKWRQQQQQKLTDARLSG